MMMIVASTPAKNPLNMTSLLLDADTVHHPREPGHRTARQRGQVHPLIRKRASAGIVALRHHGSVRGVRSFNFLARLAASIQSMLQRSTTGTLLAAARVTDTRPVDGRDRRQRDDQRDANRPDTRRTPGVRILLADDDTARASALIKVLSADPSLTILRPAPGELLADAVATLAPDVVLVDMARPDRDALEGIRVVTSNTPIVLFVDHDDAAFMEEAIRAGVSSYNVLGVPPPDGKPILRAAAAMFRHPQTGRAELREAETRLREREIVDRAKAVLIKERRMSEPDA